MLICQDCLHKRYEPAADRFRHLEFPWLRYYVTCQVCGHLELCLCISKRSLKARRSVFEGAPYDDIPGDYCIG